MDLDAEEKRINEELASHKKNKIEAGKQLRIATQSARSAANDFAVAQRDLEAAQTTAVNAQEALKLAQSKAGELSGNSNTKQLPKLKAEFEGLTGVPERLRKLQRARQDESAIAAVISTHQLHLGTLPRWGAKTQAVIREFVLIGAFWSNGKRGCTG